MGSGNYSYLNYYKKDVYSPDMSEYSSDNQMEDINLCINRTQENWLNQNNEVSSDRYEIYIKNLTHLNSTNLGIKNIYLHNSGLELKHFDVSNNLLEHLNNIINFKFPLLETLNASSNVLKCVNGKLVTNWPQIHIIDFSKNCLTEFPFDYLINTKKEFTEINLSGNLLKTVKITFHYPPTNMTNIQTLDLSNNKLEFLLVVGVTLKNLIANNNKLRVVNYFSCGLMFDESPNEVNSIVDLRNNFLMDFNSNCNFKVLDLSNNRIEHLDFMYSVKSVNTLNLGNNAIKYLFSLDKGQNISTFTNNFNPNDSKKMRELNLSYNILSHIKFEDLKIFKDLEKLNLEGNTMKELDYKSLMKNLPKLKLINLKHNRFSSVYKNEVYDFFKFESDLKVEIY